MRQRLPISVCDQGRNLHRFRDIATETSEIAVFPVPFNAQAWIDPLQTAMWNYWSQQARIPQLPGDESHIVRRLFVWTH